MPINYFKCPICKETIRTMKSDPVHCEAFMEKLLVAPQVKFEEYSDHISKEKGRKKQKDQNKMLLERARNHSRDHDMDDLIQQNNDDVSKKNHWMNEDGSKRKKIDDI